MPTAGSGLFELVKQPFVKLVRECQAEFGGIWGYNSRQLLAAQGDLSESPWLSPFVRAATEARTLGVGGRHACDGAARAGAPSFAAMQRPITMQSSG